MMTYSEVETHENYKMLVRSIGELQSGNKPTDDWEQLHFNFFSLIRSSFPDIKKLNPEIEDLRFRNTLHECEMLARYIEIFWEGHGTIEYSAYLQFLTRMRYIIEYDMDDDDIANAINAMNI